MKSSNTMARIQQKSWKIVPTATYSPGQKTWNKVKKTRKNGKDERKTLVSIFVYFLTAIAKV